MTRISEAVECLEALGYTVTPPGAAAEIRDHKAEAEINVSVTGDLPFGDGDFERRERYYLALAQVHATLYAAEQQKRIADELHTANLIGSLELIFPEEIISDTPWGSGTLDSEKRAARTHAVLGQIREGLGL